MSTEQKQSDIAEVRDQLSLDFADGEYLNVIGRNLGLDRPVLGFTDAVWRAVVRALALEYKQISNKFRDVLSIVFGPRSTEVATLSAAVALGDAYCFLNETSNLPQVGTLVFDEGLLTEETKDYCLIDRTNNKVYLVDSFGAAHIVREFDSEEPLVAVSDADELIFLKTNNFPTADYPYPIVVGRGTSAEEVILVTNNDTDTSTLALSTAPTFSHALVRASDISDQLNQPYFTSSNVLLLGDSSMFTEDGILKLYPTDTFTVTSTGTGLSDRTITISTPALVVNSLVGYELVFEGNETPALIGHTKRIVSNTATVITVAVDFTTDTAIPVATGAGDRFVINPIVRYTSLDYSLNTVTLSKSILQSFTIPTNSKVELMVSEETAALSSIKFTGTGWDVIQSTPRLVELLIPEEIRDPNDLRSSSHMHDDSLGSISTTNSVAVAVSDTVVTAVSFAAFPDAGTLEFDPGGGSAERIAYGTPISFVDSYVTSSAGTIVLDDSSQFPPSGSIVVDAGTSFSETVAYISNNISTGTLALSGTFSNEHRVGQIVKCTTRLNLQSGAVNTHSIGTTVAFYRPLYTTVPIGDFNQIQDTFPGPYIYDLGERSATATVAATNPSALVPGPSLLQIDQVSGNSVVEVEDALPTVEAFTTPFDVIIGKGTASEETVQVGTVTLQNRAVSSLVFNTTIGATTLRLSDLTPGTAAAGATFPDAKGYRVLIHGPTAVSGEVVYVLGITDIINAESTIGSGANGTVVIAAVGALVGEIGNTATVEVTEPAGTSPLTVSAVGGVLTVALDVVGGVAGAGPNTATLIAAAIDVLADFSAAATGTGAVDILAPEGPNSFSGGVDGLQLESPTTMFHSAGSTVSPVSDFFSTNTLTKTHLGSVSFASRSNALAGFAATFPTKDPTAAASVTPLIGSITVASAAGLDITGGYVWLNFGNGQVPVESTLSAPMIVGATVAALVSSDAFPSPTSFFTAIIGLGLRTEEKVLVTANNTGTDVFTLAGGTYGSLYAHSVGEVVRFEPGLAEAIQYSQVDTNDLSFSPKIVLQYTHHPVESVIDSSTTSDPRTNGYDFPFRMPVDILVRLESLLDIVRAAGIQVELITKR